VHSEFEHIATYFSEILTELNSRTSFSRTVNHEIADAPAFGEAQRLIITQCDANDLTLSSTFCACWEVTSIGVSAVTDNNPFKDCPLSSAGLHDIPEGYFVHTPKLKFNIHRDTIRFGMTFGPRWYVVKQGSLKSDGLPMPQSLVTV